MSRRELILQAVDTALSSLGEEVKRAVYYQFGKNHDTNVGGILDKPEAFSVTLKELFSDGAKVVELQIVTEICKLAGVKNPSNSLSECIKNILKQEANAQPVR